MKKVIVICTMVITAVIFTACGLFTTVEETEVVDSDKENVQQIIVEEINIVPI